MDIIVGTDQWFLTFPPEIESGKEEYDFNELVASPLPKLLNNILRGFEVLISDMVALAGCNEPELLRYL